MRACIAPRGLAVDTVACLTPYTDLLKKLGIRTVMRYVRRDRYVKDRADDPKDWYSISRQELAELLEAGLRVGFVQKSVRDNPDFDGEAGARVGDAAGWNLDQLGVPDWVTVFCDCEWNKPPKHEDQIDYIERWGMSVGGYRKRGGLYISPDMSLNASELYHSLPSISAYWKSASRVPVVNTRGFQLVQSCETFITRDGRMMPWHDSIKEPGVRVDLNMVCIDGRQRNDRLVVVGA